MNFLRLKKLISFFLIILAFNFAIPKKASAEADGFSHKVIANYDVKEDKSSYVSFNFTTRNLISNNYIQNFSLKLPFNPQSISVANSPTPINLKSVSQISQSLFEIQIEILQPVYGANKEFNWGFSFIIPDIVIDHGMQKVIFLPNFNEDKNISDYEISVNIPNNFGEIKYIYGEGKDTRNDAFTNIAFKKVNNIGTSFSILLGSDQEYTFEAQTSSDSMELFLPENNSYQNILYTEFPKTAIKLEDQINSNKFNLQKDQKVSANVKTDFGYDNKYQKTFEEITSPEIVDSLIKLIDKSSGKNYTIAQKTYEIIFERYNSYDYLTTIDTIIDLTNQNKTLLNPAELNKLFREVLTKLNIENRGVFGYVFPAQPFQKDILATEQHIWTEFWDGEKWIAADPTWYIASRGTNYFDKNNFHHIKFGNYSLFDEAKKFFANGNIIKVTPLTQSANINKLVNIETSIQDKNSLDKVYSFVIENKSNIPIELKSSRMNISGLSKITLNEKDKTLNKILYPYAKLEIPVEFEYDLLIKKQKGEIASDLTYQQINSNKQENISRKSDITINSNISSYMTEIIIFIIFAFLLISIISFVLYKKPYFLNIKKSD